jgi:hypothetical protein
MKQRSMAGDGEGQSVILGLPRNDDSLFADSARHAYLERLRGTPESCLWDFMDWRGANPSDERI